MTVRSLTWRVLVPLSLAIFLLVAFAQLRPALELFPLDQIVEEPEPKLSPLLRQRFDPTIRWQAIGGDGRSATPPGTDAIAYWESNGILLISGSGDQAPTASERREIASRLKRFAPDLVLVEHAQGSYLPLFSRPESHHGVQGYLRRWAEESEVAVYRWRPQPDGDNAARDLVVLLNELEPGFARGDRLVLAGPRPLFEGLTR